MKKSVKKEDLRGITKPRIEFDFGEEIVEEIGPKRWKLTRYTNRKIYDEKASEYVTYREILRRVREGEDLIVTDKSTGKDSTGIVLLRALEKHARVPKELLIDLIQGGKPPK